MAEPDIDLLLEQGMKAAEERAKQEEEENQLGVDKEASVKESTRSSSAESSSSARRRRRERDHRRRRSSSREDRHRRRRSSSSRRRSRSSSRHRSSRRSSRKSSSRRSRRRSSSRSSRKRKGSRRKRRHHSSSSSSSSSSGSSSASPERRSTSAERAERAKKKEMMELTRDHRTVFVSQLQRKVREKDLLKFFKQLGSVENVLLLKDKFTNRSKGIAYVEMSELDDIPKVLMMNGQVPSFQVFPIMVKASEAEKNFATKKEKEALAMQFKDNRASYQSSSPALSRIYCGNLHTNITEDDLKTVFQAFGEVQSVHINRDEAGHSKGFGFIQYSTEQEANFAISKGNGLELAGNYLKLGSVSESGNKSSDAMRDRPKSGYSTASQMESWRLDDDDGSGMQMNSHSRTALMQKLAGGSAADFLTSAVAPMTAKPVAPVAVEPVVNRPLPPIEGSESWCFVLKNMFDPATETGLNWHLEIQEDVLSECSKYGPILHSHVEKDRPGGMVYILFESKAAATKAVKSMHGRWFNKKQITVRYLATQEYVGQFPNARAEVQQARAHG